MRMTHAFCFETACNINFFKKCGIAHYLYFAFNRRIIVSDQTQVVKSLETRNCSEVSIRNKLIFSEYVS